MASFDCYFISLITNFKVINELLMRGTLFFCESFCHFVVEYVQLGK